MANTFKFGNSQSVKLITQFSESTIEEAVKTTLNLKGNHIFEGSLHPKPYLNEIAESMGGKENFIRNIFQQTNGKLPSAGYFEKTVSINGRNLTIRGYVKEGKPIINTIFDPTIPIK